VYGIIITCNRKICLRDVAKYVFNANHKQKNNEGKTKPLEDGKI
jgi:hypothetical protein